MAGKIKKYIIMVAIGALLGAIGTVLAALGLGKMKDVAYLGNCPRRK